MVSVTHGATADNLRFMKNLETGLISASMSYTGAALWDNSATTTTHLVLGNSWNNAGVVSGTSFYGLFYQLWIHNSALTDDQVKHTYLVAESVGKCNYFNAYFNNFATDDAADPPTYTSAGTTSMVLTGVAAGAGTGTAGGVPVDNTLSFETQIILSNIASGPTGGFTLAVQFTGAIADNGIIVQLVTNADAPFLALVKNAATADVDVKIDGAVSYTIAGFLAAHTNTVKEDLIISV